MVAPRALVALKKRTHSCEANQLKLDLKRFVIERFHDVFVGASADRFADMRDVIFSGAEYDFGFVTARAFHQGRQAGQETANVAG